jgi:hypothetical protein
VRKRAVGSGPIGGLGKSRTRPIARLIGAVGVLTCALMSVAVADAAPRSLNGFVGGTAGINTGGLFTQPHDVAMYTAGTPTVLDDKVLVVEAIASNSRVQRLDRDGNFERLWGKDTVRAGANGDSGEGFEICIEAVSEVGGCKSAPAGTAAGELSQPTGVAVDQSTGHVFVMDRGNRRVQEYTIDGAFVRAWGWGVDTGAAAFEICTSTCHAGRVGNVEGDGNTGQFGSTGSMNSMAISPVGSKDLFVTDAGNRRVLQFERDGDFVRGWGADVAPPLGGGFEICEGVGDDCQAGQGGLYASGWPQHIAIDGNGVAYVSDDDSSTSDRVVRFATEPPPAPSDAGSSLLDALPGSMLADGATAGLEIDPLSDNLLVARDRTADVVLSVVQEISDPGAEIPPGGPPSPTVIETDVFVDESDNAEGGPTRSLGLDPANGNVYLTVTGIKPPPAGPFTACTGFTCAGLAVLASTTGPLNAETEAPTDVGATSVQLAGSVNPGGGVARYRFQVSADGQSWTDVGRGGYVAGSLDVGVSVNASGLEPATMYRVRLLVTKQVDLPITETAISEEDVLLTDAKAPIVNTLGSSRRSDVSVRLRGVVDPEGSSTSYRFEYGAAGGSFDRHVPVPDAQAGAGNVPQLVTQDVGDLLPSTSYHYRIVATNSMGTVVGDPVTFTTRPSEPLPNPPPGRGYELVSPADKVAGVGVGIWYQGPSTSGLLGLAAHDGDRFLVKGSYGAVLVDGEFSFADDWALAERTPQGWTNEPLISRRAHGSHTLVFMDEAAVTSDLGLLGYSSVGLKLFAEQEEWIKEVTGPITYLRDWETGKWELFGPVSGTEVGGLGASLRIADDGGSAVSASAARGLAGPMDPTLDLSFVTSVWLDELPPDGASDVFPGLGVRSVVNVCTDGTEIPARVDVGGTFKLGAQDCPAPAPGRSHALIDGDRGADLGADREQVISADGSRIFFVAPDSERTDPCSGVSGATACPSQVYVRQRGSNGVVTRWISRPEVTGQDASLLGPAIFEGASKDGDKVFFRTASPLTADDPNGQGELPPPDGVTTGTPSPASWDLYMYDMPDGAGADPAGGDLVRISAGPGGGGDCNSPAGGASTTRGALRYVSDDGTRLYFACAAPLGGVALPDDGTTTSPGGTPSTTATSNLYHYDGTRPVGQRWRFVAQLPRESALGACAAAGIQPGQPLAPDNKQSPDLAAFPVNCLRGTRDGSFITFFTDGQLTDDDPDAETGDIYAYDADLDELARVTSPQGGDGGTYPCLVTVSMPRCYGDDGIGSSTGVTKLPKLGVAEDPSGSRVLFFESRSRLIPEDEDDAYDVYEWRAGELSLISAGDDDAFYVGSDRSGQDVYIATRDRLSWQDRDAVLDVYTARTGGGIPQPVDSRETCSAVDDQCHAAGEGISVPAVESDRATGGNPSIQRVRVVLARPSAKARRWAARTGKLIVPLTTTAPTTVRVSARARVAGRARRVGTGSARIPRAGAAKVEVALSKGALRRLRSGGRLTVTLVAKATGARAGSIRISLRHLGKGRSGS